MCGGQGGKLALYCKYRRHEQRQSSRDVAGSPCFHSRRYLQERRMSLSLRSKLFMLPVVLCFFAVSYGQTQTGSAALAAPVRVFALNLWNAPVDLKLGAEGIFSTTGLSPASASQ